MRTLLVIAIAAVVAFTVWSTNTTVAKQTSTISVDPTSMMTTVTNLPSEQYDMFSVGAARNFAKCNSRAMPGQTKMQTLGDTSASS